MREVFTYADYCRWANMGYRDSKRGTYADVMERVRILESNVQSYARTDQRLQKRITELEDELSRA